MRKIFFFLILILLVSCSPEPEVLETPVPPTATATRIPNTPTLTPTPTATPLPSTSISATVWENDPFVVVLAYHQFAENYSPASSSVKMRFEDFGIQLQALYDSGYSLVSLDDWMKGNIVVPEGRRPLIFSMDDLFFRNQILLDDSGDIDPNTGIGMHWEFNQEHPDFGFSWALFTNLGDKFYPVGDDPNWRETLAEAIIWCLEHDAMVYNHTYQHPDFRLSTPKYIQYQLAENDIFLRELLGIAGREDLIPYLKNIIGLPFGERPDEYAGLQVLLNYTTPEGVPLQGIMEIDYIFRVEYLPPMYHEEYDAMAMPRVSTNLAAVDWLVDNTAEFEQAQVCDLGEVPDLYLDDADYLAEHILQKFSQNGCPTGVYVVRNYLFSVSENKVELITSWQE
jgi:hypothetical protein